MHACVRSRSAVGAGDAAAEGRSGRAAAGRCGLGGGCGRRRRARRRVSRTPRFVEAGVEEAVCGRPPSDLAAQRSPSLVQRAAASGSPASMASATRRQMRSAMTVADGMGASASSAWPLGSSASKSQRRQPSSRARRRKAEGQGCSGRRPTRPFGRRGRLRRREPRSRRSGRGRYAWGARGGVERSISLARAGDWSKEDYPYMALQAVLGPPMGEGGPAEAGSNGMVSRTLRVDRLCGQMAPPPHPALRASVLLEGEGRGWIGVRPKSRFGTPGPTRCRSSRASIRDDHTPRTVLVY
jgi:hypothetical protein